ncbi:MAG TPA: Ldh family oxidoreductase [Gemmataceae bacterium]|nr:Ldh family oxidoreductase [Gemmataceae bacterium]
MANDVRYFPVERLREFSTRTFEHFGVPPADAAVAADVLAVSDLRGIDSHGVARLHAYFDLLSIGQINPRPNVRVVREFPAAATVDGDNGLGLVVGPRANEVAMAKAEAAGSAFVTVRNSNHYGIAGYYPLAALDRGLIGWAMTNSTAFVAPLGGADRMLGTNPIAIAFPAGEEPPIVIDLATSAAAFGKIEIARRKGQPIPPAWAIDRDGNPATNPDAVIDGGALLPLGSTRESGGHKGYCLAAMVDVLSAVLSGANWGPFAPPFALRIQLPSRSVGKGIGHAFGAMRVDAFIDPDEFCRQMDDWIRTMRSSRPAPRSPGVMIPGDPERLAEAERRKTGIPLVPAVVADLRDISARTGIPFD